MFLTDGSVCEASRQSEHDRQQEENQSNCGSGFTHGASYFSAHDFLSRVIHMPRAKPATSVEIVTTILMMTLITTSTSPDSQQLFAKFQHYLSTIRVPHYMRHRVTLGGYQFHGRGQRLISRVLPICFGVSLGYHKFCKVLAVP